MTETHHHSPPPFLPAQAPFPPYLTTLKPSNQKACNPLPMAAANRREPPTQTAENPTTMNLLDTMNVHRLPPLGPTHRYGLLSVSLSFSEGFAGKEINGKVRRLKSRFVVHEVGVNRNPVGEEDQVAGLDLALARVWLIMTLEVKYLGVKCMVKMVI